jgi:nicotinamide-nucleotide amidase
MMMDSAIEVMGQDVAEAVRRRGLSVAVAESLTGGLLASALARAEEASTWFRGAVVAYASEVKHDVLSVRPGPVVSEGAVVDMACHVARLLGADVGVAVTGVGGPEPQDGERPGTVWVGVATPTSTTTRLHRFEGGPAVVCEATVTAALAHLVDVLR